MAKIIELRQELRRSLREQFPEAHRGQQMEGVEQAVFDLLKPESFAPGSVIELLGARAGSGLSLALAALLAGAGGGESAQPVALVDAGDCFDPGSYAVETCARLLWVRPKGVAQALRAADLLLRDDHFPFVLLDLEDEEPRALRRLPSSSWYRLRQLAENRGSRLFVLSPEALVPCASFRLEIRAALRLNSIEAAREDLFKHLKVEELRSRKFLRA